MLIKKDFKGTLKNTKRVSLLRNGSRFIIKSRRLSYLHHILKRKESELIHRVYHAQKRQPVKGDWVNLIEDDLDCLSINLKENEIQKMNKNKFKKYVKGKVKSRALKYLNQIKEKHSKVKDIKYNKLEIQQYMTDSRFTSNNIELLFKLRTRMVQVKANFKTGLDSLICDLCKVEEEEENQSHLLNCEVLLNQCEALYNDESVEYDDIFADKESQLKAVKLFEKVLEVRDNLLPKQ